jgi:hypothetical protein
MLLTAWQQTERNRHRKDYIFTIISRGGVTPVQSLTVSSFLPSYLVTILKALISTLSSNREINIYSSVADLNAQFIYSK